MIMGSQNFLASWGKNFVGCLIGKILVNITQMLVHVYVIMGIEIHGQVFPMVPTNNDNSTFI